MFKRIELIVVAFGVVACSGGPRNAEPSVVRTTARATPAAEEAVTAPGPAKCTRRHVVTKDGREMVVYTEDTGSCDPPRTVAVTSVAVE